MPVAVITGGSSGIGRAAALAFARKGYDLGILVRDGERAEPAACECRKLGARVLVCRADMADRAAVERAGQEIVAEYGRIDVWVSCAALLLFGRFEDIPPDAFARVVEANLLGCANGSRVALAQFRRQADRGTLINTSSLLGMVGEPHVSAYVATKFAIRGFTACLRQEFRHWPGIRICLVMPTAVDTPIYGKAGNHYGRHARAIYPVIAPERVAARIVRLAGHPRREAVVGVSGHVLGWAARLTPGLLERIVARAGPALQFTDEARSPSDGNLFASTGPHEVDGGWRKYWAGRLAAMWKGEAR